MESKKVHKVAKTLGLSSAALIKLLTEIGIKAKGHMSTLTNEEIKKVKARISEEKKRVRKEFTRRYTKPKVKEKKKKIDQQEIRQTVKSTLAKIGKKDIKKHYKRVVTPKVKQIQPTEKTIEVVDFMTVAELSQALKLATSEVIKKCLDMGLMVSMNQRLDLDSITVLCDEFGYGVKVMSVEEQIAHEGEEAESVERPPVVTVMGHVDHGKTTLLDAITKLRTVEEEYGKITQRMAAYQILYHDKKITFLDTPGHEAFTAMRARGAQVTDVVILVVAADDGVMPQTVEAIDHARAANVPIIVCINKTDLPNANVTRVKTQLAKANVVIEEFGGKSISVETSALKGSGIPDLLDAILVKAEEMKLEAPVNKTAKGIIIEARLDRGKGNVSTVLVQEGTLKKGNPFVCGSHFGRVRELLDEKMNRIAEAGPSTPVLVLGFSGLPQAGEIFLALDSERRARELANQRRLMERNIKLRAKSKVTLLELQDKIKRGETKELKVILKADSAGSAEALDEKLNELSSEEVSITVVHKGVGKINVSDVLLAEVTGAICVGFHVGPDANALESAEREGVEIRTYRLIYEALDDIRSAMLGMLEPKLQEILIGEAEVRALFTVPKMGPVVGCYLRDGKVIRNAVALVFRDGKEILKTKVISLKRFKEDVREVLAGYECGVGLENTEDIQKDDTIQFYKIEETPQTNGK
ncbi:MAG: translation initiation factor IF-2 [candidate division WOR-3 bacterium]|nr:MAG: translation initiation factor IF-2 [candidate division WOR-3 bacterium]